MRKKYYVLILILTILTLFNMPKAYADAIGCKPFDKEIAEKNIEMIKVHDSQKQTYSPDEKVYIDLTGVARYNNVSISVNLRTTNSSERKYYTAYLKNTFGSETTGAYFIVPNDPIHMPEAEYEIASYTFFKTTDEIEDYAITPSGEKVPIYKVLCTTYYTTEDDAAKDTNGIFRENSYGKFTLGPKKEEPKNLFESITVDKDYTYFGGKMTFNVKTTEPIKNATLVFTDRSKEQSNKLPLFSVNLISDGISNEFTYTVDTPSYGINNVYEGNYKLEEIIFYDLNNTKYTYNTNKEKAEEYKERYLDYNLVMLLGKPINDIIKEANFELRDIKLIKNEAKVGDKINVDFNWNYNSMNIRMKSVLLTFSNESNGNVFSTYLKEISRASSIIIPSNAEIGEYTLKNVTITFDSYVGEINNIILDKSNVPEQSKPLFEQKLSIVENNDVGLYFIAEELYEESYEKIKRAKDNSVITINANEKSMLPAELFDAIKETPKQLIIQYNKNEWVFNGIDIENAKPIDVSMNIYEAKNLESEKAIKKVIGDRAVVIEFIENGELPGKALIRIKDDELFNQLKGNVYYVYHIDEIENKLNKVAVEVQKSSNGYIEFYINHNSKYVITDTEINESTIIGQDDEIIDINSTTEEKVEKEPVEKIQNNTILYIVIGVCLVIIIILIIIIMGKNKIISSKKAESADAINDKDKKEEPNNEIKEEINNENKN